MPGRKKTKNSPEKNDGAKKTAGVKRKKTANRTKNKHKGKKPNSSKAKLVVNINQGLRDGKKTDTRSIPKPAMSKLEKPEEIKERLRKEKQQKKQERLQQKKRAKIKEHSSEIVREIEMKLEKEEKEKRMVMWLGVSFFMILIISFWLVTVKKTVVNSGRVSDEQSEWDAFSQQFSEGMQQAEDDLEDAKDSAAMGAEMIKEGFGASTTEGELIPEEGQATGSSSLLGSDEIRAMQQKLEAERPASSSTNTIN